MGIRTGANAPLGCPAFDVAHDTAGINVGTIVRGYDDTNDQSDEYIFCETGANHAVNDDVDISSAYLTSAAGAPDTGAADAIVASTSGQFAWFKLKVRQPLA